MTSTQLIIIWSVALIFSFANMSFFIISDETYTGLDRWMAANGWLVSMLFFISFIAKEVLK